MAETAVASTVEVLLKQLIAVSAEEIRLIKNFSKDLEKLKESASMIRDFLEDAETKVVADKSVKRWLGKLEAVAFDADYVFDELNYHVLREKVQRDSNMKKKVRCFFPNCKSFSFRHRMARKIKDIEEKMNSINEEATRLGLRIESAPARGVGTVETDSGNNTDRVFVGRDDDAVKIVEMVKNSPTENKLSVIPIVGMGGLGKTTLARKVFHHDNIISRFENRIWVFVSENFDPETVFKSVFESLTGKKIDGSREVVLRQLRGKIGDKRFLLVLDDVWNEDAGKWDNFITSLEAISPTKGNVVMLTTRKGSVASITKTNDFHELGILSEEHCWSIIKDNAFVGVLSKEGSVMSEFEIIGRKIAEKCGGLPLAADVAGRLLRGKSEDEWRSIEEKWLLDNRGDANNVSKILKLSVDNLPSPSLMKCFAFCSIIPKGWWMEKDKMIHLWMAEGLLQTDQENDMEIEGNRVFNILLLSSLLQVQSRDKDGNIEGFGMHDFVHDLASSILNSKFLDGSHQARYISRPFKDESSPISDEHAKCLRGLFFGGEISKIMFSNMKRLHVLILNDGEMKELPVEIGKLICLRFLDISHTIIEYLPDSVGNLYHLQTFRATEEYGGEGCLRKLPRTFNLLSNLRHLYIPNIELPPEIGKMSSLQTLPYFKVGDEENCGIMELGKLKSLKGGIEIHNLEKVRDKEEAQTTELFQKVKILKLKLVWNESREDDKNNDENVLEGLQPHQHLESLKIEGFKGSSFPLWFLRMEVRKDVGDRWMRLNDLFEIHLSNCSECEEIPMMGYLPCLKSLYLSGLSNVKSLGSSFYGVKESDVHKETMIVIFPALEKLELNGMKKLTTWREVEFPKTHPREVSIFPRLEYLNIKNCQELKSAPSHFPCLKELKIKNMESGLPLANLCGSKLTTLRKLKISAVNGMECLPDGLFNNNRDILELNIIDCNNLTHLVQGKYGFTSLRHLEFSDCSELTNLPLEMLEACDQTLESLELSGSLSLTNLPQLMSFLHKMPHLKMLAIDEVPKLDEVVVEIGSFRGIEELEIGGHEDDDYDSLDRILSAFPSLRELDLYGMEEWEALPNQLQHLTTLQSLLLSDFGIEVLPEWLERLSSLRELYLTDCENLRHLPSKKVMQGLTGLDYLEIEGCPLLKQNLEEGKSDDSEWSKITHIQEIDVDGGSFTSC